MINKQYNGLELDKIINEVRGFASFSLGKDKIDQMEVSFNPLVIDRLVLQTKEALEITIHYGTMPFVGIRDVSNSLKAILKDQLISGHDLLAISDLNRGIQTILQFQKGFEKNYPSILDLTAALTYVPAIIKNIDHALNQYGEVYDHASSTLTNLKRELNQIEREIQSSLSRFIRENPDVLQETTISYRNQRACVLLKAGYKNSYQGFQHGDTSSKLATYVEPAFLVALNNKKQALLDEIDEEIARILKSLCELIKPHADALLSCLDTLATLDSIFAKANYGKKYDGMMATLEKEGHLKLVSARHPLIDQKRVVANTYNLPKQYHLLLITGSNTGGKTVSLKLIGLSVLMTYLGIPILAQEADIPYFDGIYEDITDDQSIIESLSTFSSHLKKLSTICRLATRKSLILLDELGSGTDPRDGECLGMAILDHLRSLEALTICTTHYGRLKSYGESHKDILLGSVQFDQELLQPTYHFIEGLVGQSNAFDIARKFDFKPVILEEAIKLKEESKTQDEALIEELQIKLAESVKLQEELAEKKQHLEELEKSLSAKLIQFDHTKEDYLEQAKQQANAYLMQKQQEADLLVDELKQQKDLKFHEGLKIKRALDELEIEPVDKEDSYQAEALAIGDYVLLKQTKQIGQIVDLNRKQIYILMNGTRMSVKAKDLKKTTKPSQNTKVTKPRKEFVVRSMSNECLLIGMNSQEAKEVLSKFIDDARVNQLKYIRVVHGHGQGILRKMVHDYLRSLSYVKSFQYAMQSEGGPGATVVELT